MPFDKPFVTGVNYWPRRKAMYWWNDFDASEVHDEFDLIADAGMSVVRIFLLWDHWQPSPDLVEPQRLRDLEVLCDAAAERELGLDVTFFTGHMSGPNWAPGWLLDSTAPAPSPSVRQVLSDDRIVDSSYRNMFEDEVAIDAARLLVSNVVGAFHDHPGVWMWNLGNEPDLFAHPVDTRSGALWVRDLTMRIRDIDPDGKVTTGLHVESLINDVGLRVDKVFADADVAVMHGYPMYADWSQGALDPDFVPFLTALTSALSGKPCIAEEWGGCTNPDGEESVVWEWTSYGSDRTQFMAGEEAFAEYVGQVLPRLVEVGSPGAMLWCFADYAEDLWDRPPCDDGGAKHERHFGLVRPDGTPKPHVETMRRFAANSPTVTPPTKTVELDITPDEYYEAPADHARRLYRTFLDR